VMLMKVKWYSWDVMAVDVEDIQLVKDTPVFCTSKRPLIYIKNSVMDERETDMMNVRWKMFEFKQPIPEDRQRRLQPCSTYFAKLILS